MRSNMPWSGIEESIHYYSLVLYIFVCKIVSDASRDLCARIWMCYFHRLLQDVDIFRFWESELNLSFMVVNVSFKCETIVRLKKKQKILGQCLMIEIVCKTVSYVSATSCAVYANLLVWWTCYHRVQCLLEASRDVCCWSLFLCVVLLSACALRNDNLALCLHRTSLQNGIDIRAIMWR